LVSNSRTIRKSWSEAATIRSSWSLPPFQKSVICWCYVSPNNSTPISWPIRLLLCGPSIMVTTSTLPIRRKLLVHQVSSSDRHSSESWIIVMTVGVLLHWRLTHPPLETTHCYRVVSCIPSTIYQELTPRNKIKTSSESWFQTVSFVTYNCNGKILYGKLTTVLLDEVFFLYTA